MSSARCAACLGAIVPRDKFVIADTEVFHDTCAAARGTHDSVGNRQQHRLVELQRQTQEYARKVSEISTTQRVLKERIGAEMTQMGNQLDDMRQSSASWKRRYEEARADLDRMTVERDQARAALAVARQYPEQQTVVVKPADNRDATEVRFSLLELDSD